MGLIDISYLLIGSIYALLLGSILLQGAKKSANRYFLCFLIGLFLWHLTLYLYLFIPLGEYLLFIGRLNYATGPLFSLGLLGFFDNFPKKTERSPYTQIFFWSWTVFLMGITLFTPLVDKSETYMEGIGPVVELGEWYYFYLLHVFILPVLTLFIGFRKVWQLKSIEKTRFQYAYWVFVPTMIAFLTCNLIMPIYGYIDQFVYSPLFLLPIALSCSYAMQKFRFFSISYGALKGIRIMVLLLIYVITSISVYALLSMTSHTNHEVFLVFAGLAGLVAYHLSQNHIPELISSEFKQFRSQLEQYRSHIFYCNSYLNLKQQIDTTFISRLHINSAEIFLIRDQKGRIEIPIYIRNAFIDELEKNRTRILSIEQDKTGTLKKLEAQLCFPLWLDKKIIGLFCIGSKADGEIYSQEEINEMMTAHEATQICFFNILLQSDLKEENNLMKDLIRKKTEDLRIQNTEIKNMLRQQSDFIAVTAHEFRTPLNIALLQLEDTLDSYDHNTQVLEDMDVLGGSLERLKSLTQNLFDVQQFDLSKISLKKSPQSLKEFLKSIQNEFTEMLKQKNISLMLNEQRDDVIVNMDSNKMHQVMTNIIGNAQKFTPEGGTIALSYTTTTHTIMIRISDTGPGISDEHKKRIFEKFQSTDATKGMGIGMGLYICKKIIELHKGSIHVEDHHPSGACFIISLPILAAEDTAQEQQEEY